MRVLHVIPSIAELRGGPSTAIAAMTGALAAHGMAVTVATTDDAGPGHRMDPADRAELQDRFKALGAELVFARKDTEFYIVSTGLARWLDRHVGDYDLVHVHALFSFASIAAARGAWRNGVPYVMRPLGVLDRHGMTRRRPLLKRLSFALLEKPALRRAAAVHFTSMAERDDAGRLIELDRAAVIPLGIAAPDLADPSQLLGEIAAPEGRPRLLFLSRLDPKKNLEGLMRAMAMLGDDGPRPFLLVAGGGDRHYAAGLRRLCEELGIAESVAWLGPLAGSRKAAVWAAADLFVLPSHSENFGIAAAEAMLAGLPCVLSHGVALAEQAAGAGAAYLAATDPDSLARAIRSILADASGRHEMGRRAKRYAAQQFDLATMAERLEALYVGAMSAARAGPAQFVAGRLS